MHESFVPCGLVVAYTELLMNLDIKELCEDTQRIIHPGNPFLPLIECRIKVLVS